MQKWKFEGRSSRARICCTTTEVVFITVRTIPARRVSMVFAEKWQWIVQVLAVLIVSLSWSRNCAGVAYSVGGFDLGPVQYNWFDQPNSSFYQTWADKLTFYDVDSLWFFYNVSLHNVVVVQTKTEFDTCMNQTTSIFSERSNGTTIQLPFPGAHAPQTWYFFSNYLGNGDCSNGMKFKLLIRGSLQGAGVKGKKKLTMAVQFVIVSCGLVLMGIIIGFTTMYLIRRKRKIDKRKVEGPSVADGVRRQETLKNILERQRRTNACTIYSYKELDRATNQFSADNKLGSGGFGTVYKGTLDNGTVVAVKRSNNIGGNDKDQDQFLNEVSILSQVNNRHLVKLLGCCVEVDVPLLVFQFISNGTVQEHLGKCREGYPTKLDWATRFSIAIQTAEALKYLHFEAHPPIFHRDVKTANILLDDNFNAKVADFGLSKLVELDATHVSTLVKGTPGYLDPEYYHNFQLTDKTDVYSFGMVLLELITSKKPVDLSQEPRLQNLAMASIPVIRAERTREIVDQALISELFTEDDYLVVEGVAQIAAACLGTDRALRPSIKEVVEMLQNLQRGTSPTAQSFLAKNPNILSMDEERGLVTSDSYDFPYSQRSFGTNSGQASSSPSGQVGGLCGSSNDAPSLV